MQLADWEIMETQRWSRKWHISNDGHKNGKLIMPFNAAHIQPASYDLRLGNQFRNEHGLAWTVPLGGYEDMEPGRFVLGHTRERFSLPAHLCARVEGKSTVGRRGVAVHVTAGFIDPGFCGQITLELKHHGILRHVKLWPGMLIAQISFHRIEYPQRLYGSAGLGSHYQGQSGATPAAVPRHE